MDKMILLIFSICIVLSCGTTDDVVVQDDIVESELYFPPLDQSTWETIEPGSLNWNEDGLVELFNFLSTNNTRAFIVLKDGKIVIEEYWGNNLLGTSSFNAETQWYWASAGKTITASLVGAAQKEGLLNIEDKTSDYLGTGWTSLDIQKENLIRIENQLQMTTGLDYETSDLDCTLPECLSYKADAGTLWYYHNAPYTLLGDVVSSASNMDYNLFTQQRLESLTGMNGTWIKSGFNNVYWSTARDMARFGLLTLNNGSWEDSAEIYSEEYYNQMISSSQNINQSYGYLWWLNGKNSIIFPGFSNAFNTNLSPNAPNDMYAALGKNGQFLDIVPSQNLIVIRMGEAPDNALVPIAFHDEMWELLNDIINE